MQKLAYPKSGKKDKPKVLELPAAGYPEGPGTRVIQKV